MHAQHPELRTTMLYDLLHRATQKLLDAVVDPQFQN